MVISFLRQCSLGPASGAAHTLNSYWVLAAGFAAFQLMASRRYMTPYVDTFCCSCDAGVCVIPTHQAAGAGSDGGRGGSGEGGVDGGSRRC